MSAVAMTRELQVGAEWIPHLEHAYATHRDYPGCGGTLVLRERVGKNWRAFCDADCGFDIVVDEATVLHDRELAEQARLEHKSDLPWRHR